MGRPGHRRVAKVHAQVNRAAPVQANRTPEATLRVEPGLETAIATSSDSDSQGAMGSDSGSPGRRRSRRQLGKQARARGAGYQGGNRDRT